MWLLMLVAALCRPATETHEIAERKLKELERLREAWGISEDTVEGAAFNQDLQVSRLQSLLYTADWSSVMSKMRQLSVPAHAS